MKIKVATIYSALFAFLLLAQLYIPSFKVNMLLQLGVLGFFIFSGKAKISMLFLKKDSSLIFTIFYTFYRWNVLSLWIWQFS